MTDVLSRTPEQYREAIKAFILQYYRRRRWEMEQAFIGIQITHVPETVLYASALADQLAEIARMASGDIQPTEWNRGVVYEGIQDLMERLFSSPLLGSYEIPRAFWKTDLGAMVAAAFAKVQGDELITISEAAGLLGITTQAISHRIGRGDIMAYPDITEPNPQKRQRVLRSDIEALRKENHGPL